MTLKSAFGTHSASFNSLKSSLEAAKLELFDLRISSSIEVYDDLVSSMNRLAQHLTGLRSGCTLQNRLQQAYRDGSLSDPTKDELPVDENVPMNATQKRLRESARTFRAFERSVGSSLRRLTVRCHDFAEAIQFYSIPTDRVPGHLPRASHVLPQASQAGFRHHRRGA